MAQELSLPPWHLLLVYGAVILLTSFFFKRRTGVFPPGPSGLPFFGNVFYFGKNTVQQMNQLHKKYGKTIYLKMAAQDVVVCADIDLVKNYYTKEVLQDRPNFSLLNAFTDPGLSGYNGEEWRNAKRFTMRALKQLGFGRMICEPLIHEEVEHFLHALEEESKRGPVKVSQFLGPAASNVVALFVLGERFPYDHPTRKMFDETMLRPENGNDDRMIYLSPLNFIKSAKILGYIPFTGYSKWRKLQLTSTNYITERVKHVEKNFDRTSEPKGLIEFYFKDESDHPQEDRFDEASLIASSWTFFVAGSATTQEYLEWWFLLMANHPDVQEKMREEVDRVVGSEKVALAHRTRMPYTEAVIHEVHRYASLVALNLPHVASQDTEFGPYFLPKGTQVILNLYAIHHDADNFTDPHLFKPERFLSSDGLKFTRSDKVIPFGHGKRSCPGESLAQAEIFIFTISTLQKLRVRATTKFDGETDNSIFAHIPKETVAVTLEARKSHP